MWGGRGWSTLMLHDSLRLLVVEVVLLVIVGLLHLFSNSEW